MRNAAETENREAAFRELFKNPDAKYRGAPFWAWNGTLEWEELKKQIDAFAEMGFGGFHIHSRTGLTDPYLGDRFMEMVCKCAEYAKEKGLYCRLYDEDRCPSGFAGGLVTKEEKYRAHYLVLSRSTQEETVLNSEPPMMIYHAPRSGQGELLAVYDIVLDENGMLTSCHLIEKEDPAEGTKWYAFFEATGGNPWYNYESYVDTMNPEAIAKFIGITHERYREAAGDLFGTVIPSMFTDEPQLCRKTRLRTPQDNIEVFLPWTRDLCETYSFKYGEDLLAIVPYLVWESENGEAEQARFRYHDHAAERFAQAFADQCGEWCGEHGLMMTGHLMGEDNLCSQTESTGESMRSYRAFGMPGVDMLCDEYGYTVVKQAQSAARQYGREGVTSELYGVTNWDFDFRGHKRQGDWQAAMGVTLRVPHLSWYTMRGEGKRDYPASIHYQSPWADRYHLIEDHFARVGAAMTRGKGMAEIGVIHPIESYWMHWGPDSQTGSVREQMEEHFGNLTQWLLRGLYDFDFICEANLPEQCALGGMPLQVGEMSYRAVVLPGCETIRKTTLDRLIRFAEQGGKLLVLGTLPERVDGSLSDEPQRLSGLCTVLPFERIALTQALEQERTVDVRLKNGRRTSNLIYQMREDGDGFWLFLAQGVKEPRIDIPVRQEITVWVKGCFHAQWYDTLSGEITEIPVGYEYGQSKIDWVLYQNDSLLLRLTGAEEERCESEMKCVKETGIGIWEELPLPGNAYIKRSAPNVLVLDTAEYALDGEEYAAADEVLRADNLLRARLGWDLRKDEIAQPWAVKEEPAAHTMRLNFKFNTETELTGVRLALENAERTKVVLDGVTVALAPDGWFADRCIQTVPLPAIAPGKHFLELSIPFGKRDGAEWCYLLGEFDVKLDGREKTVIRAGSGPVGFGSLTEKGLPFYGDNVAYKMEITTRKRSGSGCVRVHVPQYRGAMIEVSLDGERKGTIIYAPYDLIIKEVPEGTHVLELMLYGTRYNCFGQLHLCSPEFRWFGPDSYRTSGDEWSWEYRPKPFGILTAPVVSELME